MTRRIFVQWVDSMSVTRSLITGMFPIGSTTIGFASPSPSRRLARSWRLADLGLAGERRLAVDLHPAGAADRRPAGAADDERAVVAVLGLEQPVEHRERRVEVDVELLPVGPLAASRAGTGLEPSSVVLEASVLAPLSRSSPAAPTG